MYSWNFIVLVFGCDLDFDFFLFLSLPGASVRWEETIEIGEGWGAGLGVIVNAGDGAGGDDTDTELRGLRLDVVDPRLMGLGVGARGKIVGRDEEADVLLITLLQSSANVTVAVCGWCSATACWNAAGDADVITTAPPVVGIVRATVTIPADAAAASSTSDCCGLTSGMEAVG